MSMQRTLLAARAAAAPAMARFAARPAAFKPQIAAALRAFSTARPALADAKAPAPAAAASSSDAAAANPTPSSFSDVVQRYGGWYPFLGLAGIIAISKEVIILNEELLLVSNFAAMFGILYLGVGDSVSKAAEEERAALAKKQDDLSDFQIEQLQAVVQAHELNIEQVDVLKKLKAEHNSLSAELQRVRAVKLRHAARDAVVKRLADVKSREASERASFKEVVGAKATEYVKRTFAAQPANVKAALVDYAISVVEGKAKPMPANQDPVKKLYADYFNNKMYEQEMKQ